MTTLQTDEARCAQLARLAHELTIAWNTHDPDRVASLAGPDYEGENVGEPAPHRGPQGLRDSVAAYLAAFPDLRFTVDHTVIQGDRVVQVWRATAAHMGSLMGIPPTGRRIEVRGASVLTYKENLLCQALYIWDLAGLLRNIGLLPEL